jgi:Flp pilus assembly protein TadG
MTMAGFSKAFARRFSRDNRGVSAVEFALVLPLMLTMYLGGVEVSDAVSVNRKVTLITRSVADLTSRVQCVSSSDLTNILNAGTAIVYPYNANNITIKITSVLIDSTGKATVDWSTANTGNVYAHGDAVTLPVALDVASTSLIFSEVTYGYKPAIGYVITGTLTLTDQMYMRPRLSASVTKKPDCSA